MRGFQGREKPVIIYSLVRSNTRGRVGFLTDDRRTNVAITRAQRHLCVVGDASTISAHPTMKKLVQYLEGTWTLTCRERPVIASLWTGYGINSSRAKVEQCRSHSPRGPKGPRTKANTTIYVPCFTFAGQTQKRCSAGEIQTGYG
jgi:hypothetical protein